MSEFKQKKFTKKLNDRIVITMTRSVTYDGNTVIRTNYVFGSSCHWSPDIASLDYRVERNKVLDHINWSSGGCNNGFTVEEYAMAQAEIFKWIAKIARKHDGKITP